MRQMKKTMLIETTSKEPIDRKDNTAPVIALVFLIFFLISVSIIYYLSK
jgi:hypothetical protein